MPVHSTRRLSFFKIEPRHLQPLKDLWTNPQVMRHMGFPEGLHPDDIDLDSYLSSERLITPRGRKPGAHMAVELKDGTFVGEAKIGLPDEKGIAEPDLKLQPQFWGRGLGTEILQFLINQTFEQYPQCHTIQFTPNLRNSAAVHIYHKAGCRIVEKGSSLPGKSKLRNFVGVSYHVMHLRREQWEQVKDWAERIST